MKKAFKFFALIAIAFIAVLVIYLALHNIGDGEGRKSKSGVVTTIVGDSENFDINISFQNDTRNFYINRGLQYGCNLDSLKHGLVGKEATVYFYDNIIHSHPYHIVKITSDKKTWYTEE